GLLMSILYTNRQVADYLPDTPGLLGWARGAFYLWAVSSSGAYFLHTGFRWMTRSAEDRVDPSRRRLLQATGSALVISPFALGAYGTFIERTKFRVREIVLPVSGLHSDLDGLRLVQISDIHLSAFLSEREFARVVDAANELRAHLTVVTGDLISMRGDPL